MNGYNYYFNENGLSKNIYHLISQAINISGSYDPKENSYLFEEQMTTKEYDTVIPFLQWCHDNIKFFGRATYQERYQEYLDYYC